MCTEHALAQKTLFQSVRNRHYSWFLNRLKHIDCDNQRLLQSVV
uniref:Uncharacterized protein n=1 Tax=Arundo donax TaxID=35708 RepID=A0A0A9CFC0_ARUDO